MKKIKAVKKVDFVYHVSKPLMGYGQPRSKKSKVKSENNPGKKS